MPPIQGYGPSDFGELNMSSLINMLSAPWTNVKTMMSAILAEGTNLNPADLMQMQFALAIYFQDETLLSSIVSICNNMSKTTIQNLQR